MKGDQLHRERTRWRRGWKRWAKGTTWTVTR